MNRLIIYDVPMEYIAQFTDTSEDILIDAKQIHRYCIGCFGCWLKTPGTCIIKDGFENMGKCLSEVSEFILISKATFGSYSSSVKNVLDRSISYHGELLRKIHDPPESISVGCPYAIPENIERKRTMIRQTEKLITKKDAGLEDGTSRPASSFLLC